MLPVFAHIHTLLYSRLGNDSYEIRVVGRNTTENESFKINRVGEVLDVPFKLDCTRQSIWYWEIVSDSLCVTDLNY